MSTVHHGSNAECPDVANGKHKYCHGHDSEQTTKHTPGPWNVGWSHWPQDEEIAYGINRGQGTVSDSEAIANAKLIAAAPELLEALRAIMSGQLQGAIDLDAPRFQAAREAIRKAEGQ